MSRLTNATINAELISLRTALRDGNEAIASQPNIVLNFKNVIATYLGVVAFDTDTFNPQTLRRFDKLFDVPVTPFPIPGKPYNVKGPTQDDFAWAIQNFINRRAEPWAFLSPKDPAPIWVEGLGSV